MTTSDLVHRVRSLVLRRDLLPRGSRVIVACSGGGDSVACATILHAMAEELDLALRLVHVDHGLRGEGAQGDEDRVRELADTLDLAVEVLRVDVPSHRARKGGSEEEVARELRYEALHDAAHRWDAARIVTGHTRDDRAETLLLNLARGAGPRGLGALRMSRDDGVVRPLLEEGRADLRNWLREQGVTWQEDPSNVDPRHRRNRVRRDLIPWLEEHLNPRVTERLAVTARLMHEVSEVAGSATRQALENAQIPGGPGEVLLDRAVLETYTPALRSMVVRAACAGLAVPPWAPPAGRVETRLAEGGVEQLAEGIFLSVEDRTVRVHGASSEALPTLPETVLQGDETKVGSWTFHMGRGLPEPGLWGPFLAEFDPRSIRTPLRVRSRMPGDRFRPAGGPGTRRISDYMIDRKIPRMERSAVPILADSEGILWVVGHQLDDRARAAAEMDEVIRVHAIRTDCEEKPS